MTVVVMIIMLVLVRMGGGDDHHGEADGSNVGSSGDFGASWWCPALTLSSSPVAQPANWDS